MTYSPRHVLVTGGAGFIGSHVAEAYLELGDHVWVLDNLSSGRRSNIPQGAEFVELDIRDDSVVSLFREVHFDIVNHHAAQIDVRTSVGDPAIDASINLEGLLNLTEAAIEVGTSRFVFVSSGGVIYGEPAVIPTSENASKAPLSPYGVSKFSGELYLNYYREVHGLECVALRYSNVYGPRQDPNGEAGVVAIFSRRLLSEEPLLIFGDGEQTRDYVYIGDVVSANLLASEADFESGGQLDDHAFNVGTGIATSVNELADILELISGVGLSREHKPGRPGELRHSALNSDKLRSLGWTPATTLEQGLQETYTFIRRQMAGATE